MFHIRQVDVAGDECVLESDVLFVAGRGRGAKCAKFLLSEGKAKREKVVAERL
jgi:hypothetical protein